MIPKDRVIEIGFQMHIREWTPTETGAASSPFLLVHGLASNARTWDDVARLLCAAGYPVVAIDQRGHGRSQKPDGGYDFATITQDLQILIEKLDWDRPILAGQSWGGNVLLEFGARFPRLARGLIFVDGGFLNLKGRGSWERIAEELRPPDLTGTPRAQIAAMIRKRHPDWSEVGVEGTLNNFEAMPDGTVRPWLTLKRHLLILRSLYDQNPQGLYPQVEEPVLICVADDASDWALQKRGQVQVAAEGLKRAEIAWFPGTDHDIHVHQPQVLIDRFLEFARLVATG